MTAADLDAAHLLLARMGITPEQLLTADPATSRPRPTFREYIAQVSAAVPEGTRRAYATCWQRIEDIWGDRHIDKPTPLEIKRLCEQTKGIVITCKNSRGGRSATEHLIAEADKPSPPRHQATTVSQQPPRPSPTSDSPRSSTPQPPPATTPISTPSSSASTPKPPAAAAAHSRYDLAITRYR